MAVFSKNRSIYRCIISKTGRKGWLPDDFLLPGSGGMPGEADGAMMYDAQPMEVGDEEFERFMDMLRKACDDPKRDMDREFAAYLEETPVIRLLDGLCVEIYSLRRGIDLIGLLDVAYEWASSSSDAGLVKLGISLMGMLNLDEREDCRSVITVLGKYGDFTFYSLYAMSGWKDAEKIAADYAAHLKGWGKIHADLWLGL